MRYEEKCTVHYYLQKAEIQAKVHPILTKLNMIAFWEYGMSMWQVKQISISKQIPKYSKTSATMYINFKVWWKDIEASFTQPNRAWSYVTSDRQLQHRKWYSTADHTWIRYTLIIVLGIRTQVWQHIPIFSIFWHWKGFWMHWMPGHY